jgi:hypothetical protein
MKFLIFFYKIRYMGEMVGAGTGARPGADIFDKPELLKNGPAPQHWEPA